MVFTTILPSLIPMLAALLTSQFDMHMEFLQIFFGGTALLQFLFPGEDGTINVYCQSEYGDC